jgi:diketogulonate reductase-like aldo/keto reductase
MDGQCSRARTYRTRIRIHHIRSPKHNSITAVREHHHNPVIHCTMFRISVLFWSLIVACTCYCSALDVEISATDGSVVREGSLRSVVGAVPRIIYGTAWKKDATANLVYQAMHAGFRHIDTACQPKHYDEPGVGEGWKAASRELGLTRQDVWLQSKYTSVNGQDPNRIPYDEDAPLEEMVKQSLRKSLEQLQTDHLDSLVMHGPEDTREKLLAVWRVFESFVEEGTVKRIGISNIYDVAAFRYLYEQARIKPAVVQNRFYADTNYDVEIRKFCIEHDIEFQSFWTLGANRHFTRDRHVVLLAKEKGLTPELIMYATVMKLGITPLDGTTSKEHMTEDIALLRRIQSGEEIISDQELSVLVKILGIPNNKMDE